MRGSLPLVVENISQSWSRFLTSEAVRAGIGSPKVSAELDAERTALSAQSLVAFQGFGFPLARLASFKEKLSVAQQVLWPCPPICSRTEFGPA